MISLSAAAAGRFRLGCFLRLGATCTRLFPAASSGGAPGKTQPGTCEQTRNAQPGDELLQVFPFHAAPLLSR